ncbi:hypothetical protein KC359_g108 [Hortaea werneckii]|nr:hypothetical protein KC359_g108 [Hortaea werneckii]
MPAFPRALAKWMVILYDHRYFTSVGRMFGRFMRTSVKAVTDFLCCSYHSQSHSYPHRCCSCSPRRQREPLDRPSTSSKGFMKGTLSSPAPLPESYCRLQST